MATGERPVKILAILPREGIGSKNSGKPELPTFVCRDRWSHRYVSKMRLRFLRAWFCFGLLYVVLLLNRGEGRTFIEAKCVELRSSACCDFALFSDATMPCIYEQKSSLTLIGLNQERFETELAVATSPQTRDFHGSCSR